MIQLIKTNTAQALGQALGTILIVRHLLLEGVKVQKRSLPKVEENDIMSPLLRDLEAEFYFFSAGIYMTATFGKEGKLRYIADKCLKGIIEIDLKDKEQFKED
jgi:hypothetical protein